MGTALGLVFILAAAATGVYVGTRPTVMDGRWIAAKLAQAAPEGGGGAAAAIECDRAIPIGVAGAEFACSLGGDQQLRFRMSRDGKLEQVSARRTRPAGAGGEPGED
jgi:hypothetical protein